MNTYWRIDVNLVSMVLLGVVTYLSYLRLDHEDAFNKVFFRGCLLILTLTGFEAVTCLLNGQPSPLLRLLSTFMHVFLFAIPPLLTYYWYLLSNALTMHDSVREMKGNAYLLIPAVINLIVVLSSPVSHWTFFIDVIGVYHRGPLFWLTSVVSFSYLAFGFLMILKRRKKLLRQEFLFLMIFSLLPMVGGIIQGLVYGLLLMWAFSACALVILYLYLQERMVQTDSLTGAWTRISFEHYVAQNLKSNNGKAFGIIYADVDNLKPINDQYGHLEGDIALRGAVRAMKSVLRKGDAIARLGGDEFAIHLNVSTRDELQAVLTRIEDSIHQYNRQSGKAYALSLSFGADLFYETADNSIDAIIRQVDLLMYRNKRNKHASALQDI